MCVRECVCVLRRLCECAQCEAYVCMYGRVVVYMPCTYVDISIYVCVCVCVPGDIYCVLIIIKIHFNA